jgi:hypothetical protein
MSPHPHTLKRNYIIATLMLLMILACGPLNRLQQFNRQNQLSLTTRTPVVKPGGVSISAAYGKIQTLPGYRLEIQHIIRQSADHFNPETMVGEYDAQGNIRFLAQNSDGQQNEVIVVDGITYVFDSAYEGWVKSNQSQLLDEISLADLKPVQSLIQLTTLSGTVPVEVGQETLFNRSATRYTIADTIASPGQTADTAPVELRGTLWLDDDTGAIVKSEIFFYEDADSFPTQEFLLEVSAIGDIDPITVPTPVVNPEAIAAATATAQAQFVLPGKLSYGEQQVTFEIVPEQVTLVGDTSTPRAEVWLTLRQLPESLNQGATISPFLEQLGQQLSLSIPEQNLVVPSDGFRLEARDDGNSTLNVVYAFNVDLGNFSHVELILSGQGNPMFAPVPVEK